MIFLRLLPVDTSSTNANIRVLVLDDQDLVNVEDPSMVLLVKLKDVNSMSNMYVICRNEERVLVEVHGVNYNVHEYELGTWNINIVDETLDSSDNIDVNGMEHLNSMSNMYVICRNVGSTELKIHHSLYSWIKIATPFFKVDERMILIEIRGLSLCAWGSNAYKKVGDMFGKFMFFENEESTKMSSGRICISTKSWNFVSERVLVEVHRVNYVHVYGLGTWNINIVDETLYSSDNIDVNGMEKVKDSVDENSLTDLNDLNN
nr:RNA-directed DNA polymerase, eukaryota [Tanacetum cinerariifolium]